MTKLKKAMSQFYGSWFIIAVPSISILVVSLLVFHPILDHRFAFSDLWIESGESQNRDTLETSEMETTISRVTTPCPSLANLKSKSFVDIIGAKAKIHDFNRRVLLPRIKSLVSLDYFRYVKINLNRPCRLWCDAHKCNSRDCRVEITNEPYRCPEPTYDKELSVVNTELASDQLDILTRLFECNDNDDQETQYIDLILNPERFTGYSGESANKVWRAIYEENCFVRKIHSPFNNELCFEERLFYEAISGLHSSITIHLCAEWPSVGLIGNFEPNLDEFLNRFEGHNDYLENLYTLFMLELKALAISEPYLLERVKWPEPATKDAVHDLLKILNKLDIPKFEDLSLKPNYVSHELAVHFRNITTSIIDCVACDKCKLWGKVQLRGLGAAFKILSIDNIKKLNLNHQEIVSLINAIARLSHSIKQLELFRDIYTMKREALLGTNR